MTSRLTLIPDSNIFLQCRDLPELPWAEVLGEHAEIELLVSSTVQREIDNLKQDGGSRRSKRARKTTTLFREMLTSPEMTMVIRAARPRVIIGFMPDLSGVAVSVAGLNVAHADDAILADILRLQSLRPDAVVKVMTSDSLMALTAIRFGIEHVHIPDSWLLPPEPDPRDKLVRELQAEVKLLAAQSPVVTIQAHVNDQAVDGPLEVDDLVYQPLSSQWIEASVSAIRVRNPMVTRFGPESVPRPASSYAAYRLPSDESIAAYQQKHYPAWLERVREGLALLPQRLRVSRALIELDLEIENTGLRSAQNVLIEIAVTPGIAMWPPEDDTDRRYERVSTVAPVPAPPVAPQGKWRTGQSVLGDSASHVLSGPLRGPAFEPLLAGLRPEPRDRFESYWKPSRPTTPLSSWVFECEELRHQVEPWIQRISLVVDADRKVESAALECRVTASNLPRPAEYKVVLRLHRIELSSEAQANEWIKSLL